MFWGSSWFLDRREERQRLWVQNSPSDENDNCGDDGSEEDKAAKDAQGDDSS